jgi:hypothetical protein
MRIKVGCKYVFKFEKPCRAMKKRNIPISISIIISALKDEILLIFFLSRGRFRSVKVVPEVKAIAIKVLEVIIITKYDLFSTPNSRL